MQEYTGEVITKAEGDRRSVIYDERKNSYLFTLNNQFDVDSQRKGNKIKFANCPTKDMKANVMPKVMLVNGDHRVCIFASRDIAAGEELILEYNWSDEIKAKYGIIDKLKKSAQRDRPRKTSSSHQKKEKK